MQCAFVPLRALPALVMNFILHYAKGLSATGFFFKVIIFKTQALLSGYLVAKKSFCPGRRFSFKIISVKLYLKLLLLQSTLY
jgi:hypothetical protein